MSKLKNEVSQKYDQIKGNAFCKAIQLITEYSCLDGFIFSAKTSRAFSTTTSVKAPHADIIAARLDDHGIGALVQSIPEYKVIANVPDLISRVIGSDIYDGLIEGDKLKAIVDVILEKNNLTAQYVFIDLSKQRMEAFRASMEKKNALLSSVVTKAEGVLPAAEMKPAASAVENDLNELEALKATHEKLIKSCAAYKNDLDKIKNARATAMKEFIDQLELKLLPNGAKNTPDSKEELQKRINNFSQALQNNVHKFNRLKDPELNRFIKQVLIILATVLASIPTLGIVAGCMAAYGHFAKKDSGYFWRRKVTGAEVFKGEALGLVKQHVKKAG